MRLLAVIGNITRDVVDGSAPRLGGAPFYAARALRALGTPAVIVTKGMARELVAFGLPVVSRPSRSITAFTIVNQDGGRDMIVEELGERWTPEDARGWVADAMRRVGWVHVAPLLRSDFPAETVAELASGGRRLSLDGQGLVRVRRVGPLELDAEFDPELLRHVSVLKLAHEEARVLLGEIGEPSLKSLGVPEIVVTRGAEGSMVWAAGQLTDVPARPVPGVGDPTGAGDAFGAAYLASRSAGHHPVAAARRANAFVGGLLSGRLS